MPRKRKFCPVSDLQPRETRSRAASEARCEGLVFRIEADTKIQAGRHLGRATKKESGGCPARWAATRKSKHERSAQENNSGDNQRLSAGPPSVLSHWTEVQVHR
jgi:hypothetical protein